MIRINSDGYLDAKGDMLVKEWRGQMFRPKYDFAEKKWIETATEEEIEEINNPKQIDILSVKQKKIQESKELLATWLEEHPLSSSVHGQEATYTVTAEKQSLLTQNILLAQLKQVNTTTWNCQGGICEEWTVQELSQLALEIESYVRPRIKKQQTYEAQINECMTAEEVNQIEIEYDIIS